MGFNSTRRYRDGRLVDILLLVGGTLLTLALVAWAIGLFG